MFLVCMIFSSCIFEVEDEIAYFEFTDDKGNHLTDIKIGNGKVEQLTVIDGKISADYRFEVDYDGVSLDIE